MGPGLVVLVVPRQETFAQLLQTRVFEKFTVTESIFGRDERTAA